MKNLLITAFLLSNLIFISYAQTANDKEEITRVANSFFNSWNRHDFSDMSSYTTKDFSFVIGPGILWKGRNQVQKGHETAHKGIMKNTSFTPEQQSFSSRMVTPDVAIVNLSAKMGAYYPPDGVDRGNNKGGDNRYMLTMVEVKKDGKWLLTAAQGTAIDSQAEAVIPH